MAFPAIPATAPTVTEGQEPKEYDTWWIQRITIDAIEPNSPVVVTCVLRHGLKNRDGTWELAPRTPENVVRMKIEDLFTEAAKDAELAQIVGGLMLKVQSIGTERRVL